jgi:hypothetical protein
MDTTSGITKNKSNDNIHFLLEENEQNHNHNHNNNETDGLEHDDDSESELDIDSLMEEFDKVEFTNNVNNHHNFDFLGSEYFVNLSQDQSIAVINNYNENYSVKELQKICEYYGITKSAQKLKKMDVIFFIMSFESAEENLSIVLKRKQLWHYIESLKEDKFMKRYVLW